jgi:hypothetical protein
MIVLQEGTSTISINGTSYNVSEMSNGQHDIPVAVEDSANPQCTTTKTVSIYKCDLSNITNFTYTINGTVATGTFGTSVFLSSGQTMQVTGVTGTDGMTVTYNPNPPNIAYNAFLPTQTIYITITDQNGCTTNRQIQVNSQADSGGGGDPSGGGALFP